MTDKKWRFQVFYIQVIPFLFWMIIVLYRYIIGGSFPKGDPDPVDEHGFVLGGGRGEEQWAQTLTGIDNTVALLSGGYRLGK